MHFVHPKKFLQMSLVVALGFFTNALCAQSFYNDSVFSYQGVLKDDDIAADGPTDFIFTIYHQPEGGMPASDPITKTIDVKEGLFSTTLDFGYDALDARQVYLEIQVAPFGGSPTTLSPRQRITAAPLALQASGATVRGDTVRLIDGADTSPVNSVNNPGPADGYELDNSFTQVFMVPTQAVLSTISVEMKRPFADTPAPLMHLYEGTGTGENLIVSRQTTWSFANSAGIQDISASLSFFNIVLNPGQAYTIALDPSDSSVSRAIATGAGVGDSSGGSGIASVFRVSVFSGTLPGVNVRAATRAVEAHQLILSDEPDISPTGDLYVGTESPLIQVDALDNDSDQRTAISLISGWKRFPQSSTTEDIELRLLPESVSALSRGPGSSSGNEFLSLDLNPTRLTLRTEDIDLDSSGAVFGEDLMLEADDAVLGMYSTQGGSFGSAVVLGELDGMGNFVDKWAMTRRTSIGNGELQFTYGSSPNYGNNQLNFAIGTNGNAWLRGMLAQGSSAVSKHNISTIQHAIETLLQIRGVRYQWNADDKEDIGFIAEEMAEALPEIVHFDDQGKPVGIDYGRVSALLVQATKEQQEQINRQAKLIEKLAERIEKLEMDGPTP